VANRPRRPETYVTSRTYSLTSLPVASPRYATYSSTLPLVFGSTPVVAVPGVYRVDAAAAGYAAATRTGVDIGTVNQNAVHFTLNP